jgi:hypothetical protein
LAIYKGQLVSRWTRRLGGDVTEAEESVDGLSVDLAYELQSKMFDQLATVSLAGAGLTVTLVGSVLRDAPRDVWLSVVLFVMAAVTAVGGNQKLIDSLSRRQPSMRRSKRDVQIALTFIGVAIGWLSMSIYADGERLQPPAASATLQQ